MYTQLVLGRDKMSNSMGLNLNDNVINRLYTFKPVKYNTLEHNA